MAHGSVVVHSVDRLEDFRNVLAQKHAELEDIYNLLSIECDDQGENWSDPQYTHLKNCIEGYYQASKTQLAQLEESCVYITGLIEILRAI